MKHEETFLCWKSPNFLGPGNDSEIRLVNLSLVTVSHCKTFLKNGFLLNLSDHLYSKQVCPGTGALLTPVQNHSDAPNI